MLENQLALGGRSARPAHADHGLHRCVRAAARAAPGRQRRGRAHRGRGVLRRAGAPTTSSARASPTCRMPGPLRGARPPAARDRRRRAQPGRRRHVRRQVFFEDFDPAGRRILVVGCLKGRDPAEMLSALRADEFDVVLHAAPRRRRAACRRPSSPPRRERSAATRSIECATVDAGLRPRRRLGRRDDAVLVTGSLYVVGDARPSSSPVA